VNRVCGSHDESQDFPKSQLGSEWIEDRCLGNRVITNGVKDLTKEPMIKSLAK